MSDIEAIITSLYQLSIAIGFEFIRDIEHISHKLPNTPGFLLERLLKANIRRRQYMKYSKDWHDMIPRDDGHTLSSVNAMELHDQDIGITRSLYIGNRSLRDIGKEGYIINGPDTVSMVLKPQTTVPNTLPNLGITNISTIEAASDDGHSKTSYTTFKNEQSRLHIPPPPSFNIVHYALAHHLQELALFTLPNLRDEINNETDSAGDQVSQAARDIDKDCLGVFRKRLRVLRRPDYSSRIYSSRVEATSSLVSTTPSYQDFCDSSTRKIPEYRMAAKSPIDSPDPDTIFYFLYIRNTLQTLLHLERKYLRFPLACETNESWYDYLWWHFIDYLFLRSSSLSLLRKELAVISGQPEPDRHDGVFRCTAKGHRFDLGLIEAIGKATVTLSELPYGSTTEVGNTEVVRDSEGKAP
ncbi:hypothetical protein EV426DRAFT_712574 [Tirmania nivea]|nr:hypothetical protein EV426DRAFT_712574 [Tirmania nivea]